MTGFGLRFDMRAPEIAPTPLVDRYAAALDICEWADALGCSSIVISEHHGSPDGYLPSPMVFAAAVAARTKQAKIVLSALIVPLHDPLRAAEDLAVLDLISGGRLVVTVGAGYVPFEFAMFDRRIDDRAPLVEEAVAVFQQAWTGEEFEYRGRTARITPRPAQQPRPPILLGGSTKGAARRAARIADWFSPSAPGLWETYRAEVQRVKGFDPGPEMGTGPIYLHVAHDPDAAWKRLAPYAMHEMNAYGTWWKESNDAGYPMASPYSPVADADALRATGAYPVLTPAQTLELAAALGDGGSLLFHPLMGGTDPELAWESLRLFEAEVWPAIKPS
jgi:alkanesulfonate monooxygenase SsuD/methylene tetrahydromethanopterin reductase-like flavin-dependent oxidoreductase (luciferase family)